MLALQGTYEEELSNRHFFVQYPGFSLVELSESNLGSQHNCQVISLSMKLITSLIEKIEVVCMYTRSSTHIKLLHIRKNV